MKLLTLGEGNTPLSPEEENDLIPNLATREDLNEWERLNILKADSWATDPRNVRRRDPLTESYVRELHRRMFDQTWRWAGKYRTTEKNIGIEHYRIRECLPALIADCRYWLEHQTYVPDEIAIRFHHRLVSIHPFSNGNGRHARLITDVLALRQQQPVFNWGSKDLVRQGAFRRNYIDALQAADNNDIQALLRFARF